MTLPQLAWRAWGVGRRRARVLARRTPWRASAGRRTRTGGGALREGRGCPCQHAPGRVACSRSPAPFDERLGHAVGLRRASTRHGGLRAPPLGSWPARRRCAWPRRLAAWCSPSCGPCSLLSHCSHPCHLAVRVCRQSEMSTSTSRARPRARDRKKTAAPDGKKNEASNGTNNPPPEASNGILKNPHRGASDGMNLVSAKCTESTKESNDINRELGTDERIVACVTGDVNCNGNKECNGKEKYDGNEKCRKGNEKCQKEELEPSDEDVKPNPSKSSQALSRCATPRLQSARVAVRPDPE